MTRINTNISSLNAQVSLAKSNSQLQEALTRLSTGLRINSGKDDPAGLIASETLRSDMVGTRTAISNSQQAEQMIATADSALGQVSSLLDDVRALVDSAANKGSMSDSQIAANQLQLDSSLAAIDRISQTTQFQGRALLDGNLDFISQDVDSTKMTNLQVNQANLGAAGQVTANVKVTSQATQASLTFKGNQLTSAATIELGGAEGFQTFSFDTGTTVQQVANAINLVSDATGVNATLTNRVAAVAAVGDAKLQNVSNVGSYHIDALTAGQSVGNFTVNYTKNLGGATAATWNAGNPSVINVGVAASAWTAATANATATVGTGAGVGNSTIQIAAKIAGSAFSGVSLVYNGVAGSNSVSYDYANKILTVNSTVGSDATSVAAQITTAYGNLFTVTAAGLKVSQAGDASTTANMTAAAVADGGTVTANITAVTGAINGVAAGQPGVNVLATIDNASGAQITDVITHSAFIGDVNSAVGADEPNNRIQFTTTGAAANMPIVFQSGGPNQSFGLQFVNNTRTNGKSTAYIAASATTGGTLQVQANTQGVATDGITVRIINSATDKSVIWDKQNNRLDVYAAVAGETLTTIGNRITAAGNFTASVIGDAGNLARFTTLDSGVTKDGSPYDSVVVNLATDAAGQVTTTAAEVVSAINGSTAMQSLGVRASNVTSSTGAGVAATGTASLSQLGMTAVNQLATGDTVSTGGAAAQLRVTANTAGAAYNNVKVNVLADTTSAHLGATYDASNKVLTFHIASVGNTTATAMANAFLTGSDTAQSVKDMFSVSALAGGAGNMSVNDIGWLGNGVSYTGTSQGGIQSQGNFDAGQVVGTSGVTFKSNDYGTKQFVSVKALSGTFTTYDTSGVADVESQRTSGTNASVSINGMKAVSDGLKISLSNAILDLGFNLSSTAAAGSSFSFKLTGGGALFQIGPNVVSNQQARMGIGSVNSSRLGGTAGRLDELKSGGTKSLTGDVVGAGQVVNEAITGVSTLRGRLGAFQKTTLDTNIATLNDTLQALTDAESSIRDADFASETSKLTRAQILSQSGMSVLTLANNRPQQVLGLLPRG